MENLVELKREELSKVNGGVDPVTTGILIGIAAGSVISLFNNFGEFLDGIEDGYNAARQEC